MYPKHKSDEAWEIGFSALELFKRREGHCVVPRRQLEGNFRLGNWVAVQRYERDTIDPSRKMRLNNIGFVWNCRDRLWEEGFAALMAFKAREGHCHVLPRHIEGVLKLGYWVSTQRRKRWVMSEEREERLNGLDFVWDVLEAKRNGIPLGLTTTSLHTDAP